MNGQFAVAVAVSLSAPTGAHQSLAQPASCRFLNELNGKGLESRASCISGDGRVVAGLLGNPIGEGGPIGPPVPDFQAFRWTEETGIIPMGGFIPPPLSECEATSANSDGSVLVGYGATPGGQRPFRWTAESGFVELGHIDGKSPICGAWAVSDDGTVIVGNGWPTPPGLNVAFRWTAESGMENIGVIPTGEYISAARAVSADGTVVAGTFKPTTFGQVPFRWTEPDGMVSLGILPGGDDDISFGRARGISADGSVVVGQSDSDKGLQAFRWTEATGMVGIGSVEGGKGFFTLATAVSADGNTVVGYGHGEYGDSAFFWTPETGAVELREWLLDHGVLNVGNRALLSATDVSADGKTIVGIARYKKNKYQVWGPYEGFIAYLGGPACYADCDGSGSLDIDDFLCFQAIYGSKDPAADCDASGIVDIADFVCFQAAFAAGCP